MGITVNGQLYEVVETRQAFVNDDGTYLHMLLKPVASEREMARQRVKAFLEARPKDARGIRQDVVYTMNTRDSSFDLIRADLELLVEEGE